jgi:serine/threonine-protein kinase
MALSAGTQVGPYEIVAPLGAGGMGEVYRAHDLRLKRDVALKVLPAEFADDADRVGRFAREAELLASLNHTNIAGIYGVETFDGTSAIVLELVEGETLAEQIARGPLPLAEALPIARQTAEALEAAHDKGIIHRDLKPANIKVTDEGRVKVLDFGLAKLLEAGGARAAGATGFANSPTFSVHATYAGAILGTAAYMSPEQARGKKVDQRTDVWAFGCVLFEMLTGKPPFETGDTVSDAIASILKNEPHWESLPADTPAAVRALLKRCLQKDVQRRVPHIGVARLEIDESLAGPIGDERIPIPPDAARRGGARWPGVVSGLTAGSVLGAAAVTAVLWNRPAAEPVRATTRLEASLGGGLSLTPSTQTGIGQSFALSPDGTTLVFVGQQDSQTHQLYARRLNQLQPTALAGTRGARAPFFSSDGEWVGFFADGKLKKVALTGGAAVTLTDAPDHRGGTWADDDTIVFAATPTSGLSRVAATGGLVEQLTQLAQGEVTHRWPRVLPGSRALLYEAHTSRTDHDNGTIVVETLVDHSRKVLHRGGFNPGYLRSGHLAFIHQGTLFAAPFDIDRLEMTGQPKPALEGISSNITSGYAHVAASNDGTLVYVPGESVGSDAPMEWIDRKGQSTPLRASPFVWASPSFSPDGTRLALQVVEGQADIWIHDVNRDDLARLTSDPANELVPTWTPDGRRITFGSTRDSPTGSVNLFWQPYDASSDAQRLTSSTNIQTPGSWHPSGKFLAFVEIRQKTQQDIMILPMEGSDTAAGKPGTPDVFFSSASADFSPAFSPDGRWLAYASNESGRLEVYVRPFPGPGGRVPISTDGGNYPTWSKSTRELVYADGDGRVTAVTYDTAGDVFHADKPRPWASDSVRVVPRVGASRTFALHPDGNRLVAARAADVGQAARQETVVFISNFFDELRRLTATTTP